MKKMEERKEEDMRKKAQKYTNMTMDDLKNMHMKDLEKLRNEYKDKYGSKDSDQWKKWEKRNKNRNGTLHDFIDQMSKKMKDQEMDEDMSDLQKEALERKFKNWAEQMQATYKDEEEQDDEKASKKEFENLFNNVTREFMANMKDNDKEGDQMNEEDLKEIEQAFGMLKNTMEQKYKENQKMHEEEKREE